MHALDQERSNASSQDTFDLLYSDRDLERLTGRARSTWQKMRLVGDGPPFIKISRHVRYRRSEFLAWLAGHRSRFSTSDNGEAA